MFKKLKPSLEYNNQLSDQLFTPQLQIRNILRCVIQVYGNFISYDSTQNIT